MNGAPALIPDDTADGHFHPPVTHTVRSIVAHLNAVERTGYEIAGTFPGGKVGAFLLTGRGGDRCVLKCIPGRHADRCRQSAIVVETLREHGYPTPAFRHVGEVAATTYVVTGFVAGVRMPPISRRTLPPVLELIELHGGIRPPVDHDWSAAVRSSVFEDAPAWCATVRARSADAGRVVDGVLDTVAPLDGTTIPAVDAVHSDMGPHNILVDDRGRVAGVIDCDAAGKGTRAFDLGGLIDDDCSGELHDELRELIIDIAGVEVYVIHAAYRLLHGLRRAGPDALPAALADAAAAVRELRGLLDY